MHCTKCNGYRQILHQILCGIPFFIFLLVPVFFYVKAINMESDRFRIEYGNVNTGGNKESSTHFRLSTTLGQTAAGQFSSAGFIIKAGFQYIYSIIPFSFAISSTNIDFETLEINVPKTVNATLTVSFGSAGTYQVTAEEIGKLRTSSGSFIVDTTCNGGAETCTITVPKLWTSASTYGFGYNMSGDDVPVLFSSTDHYRPFPDRLLSEAPAVLMTSTNVGKNRIATIKYKANISAVQSAGAYQTIISFIATPSF